MKIAVLMTCFNRREKTLASLEALMTQRLPDDVWIDVYLVDAGSTDGTASAVRGSFPLVHVIEADTSFFWNAGMRLAFDTACRNGSDYYLWLNDDTTLDDNAIDQLLRTEVELRSQGHTPAIVAGCTRDHAGRSVTYGGQIRRSRWRPLKFDLLPISVVPMRVDTMNGNCVLLSEAITTSLGNLDPSFVHSLGDFDYGLRARSKGIGVWMAPGSIGTCELNSPKGTWQDTSLDLRSRWKKITGPKGIPPSEWRVFAQRYGGPMWPLYWAVPYVRLVLTTIMSSLQEKNR